MVRDGSAPRMPPPPSRPATAPSRWETAQFTSSALYTVKSFLIISGAMEAIIGIPETLSFIQKVRLRPILWDFESNEFNNTKIQRMDAWLQVYKELKGTDEHLSPEKERDICSSMHKKWKNLRDCFSREMRKRIKRVSVPASSLLEHHKAYMYFDELMFLKSHLPDSSHTLDQGTVDSPMVNDNRDGENQAEGSKKGTTNYLSRAYRLSNTLYKTVKRYQTAHQKIASDEDRMFFLSLVTDMRCIPYSKKLETRMEIMRIILQYSGKLPQTQTSHSSPYSYFNQPPMAIWSGDQQYQLGRQTSVPVEVSRAMSSSQTSPTGQLDVGSLLGPSSTSQIPGPFNLQYPHANYNDNFQMGCLPGTNVVDMRKPRRNLSKPPKNRRFKMLRMHQLRRDKKELEEEIARALIENPESISLDNPLSISASPMTEARTEDVGNEHYEEVSIDNKPFILDIPLVVPKVEQDPSEKAKEHRDQEQGSVAIN